MIFDVLYKIFAGYVKLVILTAVVWTILIAKYTWKAAVWLVKLPFRILRAVIPGWSKSSESG